MMRKAVQHIEGIGDLMAPRPLIKVLGVKYLHLCMEDGTDLYLTEHGLPFTECLFPMNHWGDKAWMKRHGVRLRGTSAVHRVRTKKINNRSKEIVIKWNRMGQDLPGKVDIQEDVPAEFNSPFMEFSLVSELRRTRHDSPGCIYTQRPLAIYVPRTYVKGEQLGRKRHKMEAVQRRHEEFQFDWNRNYAVIYEWLKGIDAAEAHLKGMVGDDAMAQLLERANQELYDKGFLVGDNKPQHVIVRPNAGDRLKKAPSGKTLYGLIDFELLKRTPAREEQVRAEKRREYLVRQAHRFESREDIPEGLSHVNIMGVDYVFGRVESTGGALWVVGRDPNLFDYFLPEKWRRTPRTRLSSSHEIYKTVTADNVRLVWRVSRVGRLPDADPYVRREKRILDYGYNSPFQEVALAMTLMRKGVATTYPRAVYMTGHRSDVSSRLFDEKRYKTHEALLTPEGQPILSRQHEYISIWGYWNAPDQMLAVKDEPLFKGIDALSAYREGRLSHRAYVQVMRRAKKRLAEIGVEDLSLRGNHLLLSLDRNDRLVLDEDRLPMVRISNFELLKQA